MTAEAVVAPSSVREVQRLSIGGLPIDVLDREESAEIFVRYALRARASHVPPLVVTSANGQVLSLCASNPKLQELFKSADMIHADGMPLVFASKIRGQIALPERVATTDLFHDVAQLAQEKGVRFYMLGASEENLTNAVAEARRLYPKLDIAGYRNGYFKPEEEAQIIDGINKSGADILWIAMGAPRELEIALKWRAKLKVGVIKTSGGLFDFLSGRNSRAPQWMQDAGFEWLYRLWLEPRRLFRRYAVTNSHSAYLLLSKPVTALPAQGVELD